MILFLIATALAAEPTTPTTPEVNPTVEYLSEQFQMAIEKGLPLASAGVQEITTQIHYLGIGLLIYDALFLLFGAIFLGIFYKIIISFREEMEFEEVFPRIMGTVLTFFISMTFIVNGLDETSEHLKMTTAPLIWALEKLI